MCEFFNPSWRDSLRYNITKVRPNIAHLTWVEQPLLHWSSCTFRSPGVDPEKMVTFRMPITRVRRENNSEGTYANESITDSGSISPPSGEEEEEEERHLSPDAGDADNSFNRTTMPACSVRPLRLYVKYTKGTVEKVFLNFKCWMGFDGVLPASVVHQHNPNISPQGCCLLSLIHYLMTTA